MSRPIGILDLDSMLHIVAAVQYSSGNRDNHDAVKNHVLRFISTVCKNSKCSQVIPMFQDTGHTNFRKDILPSYKGHRTTSDAIALWKPTIIEAFREANAYGLSHVETDDAMSVLAEYIGYDKVLLITGDKDMQQLPTAFYNPFKKNLNAEDRWSYSTKAQAERFFWAQVLAGDSTDMPTEFCGIEGVGMKTAYKLLDAGTSYTQVIQTEYSKRYGDAAFKRADVTFKMVRLLTMKDVEGGSYANESSVNELRDMLCDHEKFFYEVRDYAKDLFTKMDPVKLFK